MTCIMFWNVAKGSGVPYLRSACLENDVDLLILAEDTTPLGSTLAVLNGGSGGPKFEEYHPVPSAIKFFKKIGAGKLELATDAGSRVSLRAYTDNAGNKILIAAAHLPSKIHDKNVDQAYEARRLRDEIERVEVNQGHSNTIIIGDMNMNPYESGMISADGLHGLMDANIASKIGRIYKGKYHSYFYNPMWGRLGDESSGPAGTHFYSGGGLETIHWHTFDQVLFRPSLIPAYKMGSLSTVTQIGTESLIKNNRINKNISDHLPLLLRLKLGAS